MEGPVSSVHDLIYNLNRLRSQESHLIKPISDFDLLLTALHELDSMVEMETLKDSIVKQIKFLLVNSSDSSDPSGPSNYSNTSDLSSYVNDNKNIFDGHMLHTVIYGPPGVGKTRVCGILVKIWIGLGVIGKFPPKSSSNDTNVNNLDKIKEHLNTLATLDKTKNEVIARLQGSIFNIRSQLRSMIPLFDLMSSKLRKIRRHISPTIKEKGWYEQINAKPITYNPVSSLDEILTDLDIVNNFLTRETNRFIPDEAVKFGVPMIDLVSETVKVPVVPNILVSNIKTEPLVRVVGREDLVGGFLGQTALKTEALLKESLGKVLFIDEAYSIVNDERDSYGREALTVLNRFMSEHPNEIIIIFAGYRDLMEQTIFKFQPGLKSRCTWSFEIDGYSEIGLMEIFKSQLRETEWSIRSDVNLVEFFREHKEDFPAYGRDTHRLVFYCKMCYTEHIFDSEGDHNKIINTEVLEKSLEYLKENRVKDINEMNPSYDQIYL